MYTFENIAEIFANYVSETYWYPGVEPHIIHVSMRVSPVLQAYCCQVNLSLQTTSKWQCIYYSLLSVMYLLQL